MRRWSVCLAMLLIAWLSAGVRAQESAQKPLTDLPGVQTLARIGQRLQQLGDWDQQHDLIDQSVNAIWQQHQWQSEPDLFARDTALEVAKIPPWEIDARIEKLVGRYGDRFGISPEIREQLKQRVYGQALGLVWKHGGVLMEQTETMVDMRMQSKPFTPELVARWTRQTDPMFEDFAGSLDALSEEFGKHVDAQHQELWARETESFKKRMMDVRRDRQEWADGKWTPQSWGMQSDPIHRQAAQAAARAGTGLRGSQADSSARVLAYDPATWKWYLSAMVTRYSLDAGQRAAARSILAELVERATLYIRAHRAELDPVPRDQRPSAPGFAQIRAMFRELKDRLERIPTIGQRRQVMAQPTVN
ncbi:MAG: hypothetical protein ACE5GE_07830 [Phycisphaerae bacterium]